MKLFVSLLVATATAAAVGCGGARPAPQTPTTPTTTAEAPAQPAPVVCDATQIAVSQGADTRATPWSIAQHLAKNFPDGRISWLMPESKYQDYVVKPAAQKWGRCNETACYLFAAPAAVIQGAVKASMLDGHHDPAALGKALGLPAKSFEGPLRLMTLDVDDAGTCVRLPVDEDPGVWKCQTPEDKDCFKFGGYTSGGIAEIMVLNAPVASTTIEQVP